MAFHKSSSLYFTSLTFIFSSIVCSILLGYLFFLLDLYFTLLSLFPFCSISILITPKFCFEHFLLLIQHLSIVSTAFFIAIATFILSSSLFLTSSLLLLSLFLFFNLCVYSTILITTAVLSALLNSFFSFLLLIFFLCVSGIGVNIIFSSLLSSEKFLTPNINFGFSFICFSIVSL